MCGIVGLVAPGRGTLADDIVGMRDTLVHRGPDGEGAIALPDDGVALGMRRLAIVDLEGGRQPMWDESRRYAVVFNGEIYDHATLRAELEALGHRFATDHSDTEVIVHGFEQWGRDLFPRLNGMFAIAVWDRDRRVLTIARDRAGEKPLYVARLPAGYAIASELKAILALPDAPREVDPIGLEQLLAFGFVMGPRTILRGTEKLPAGHIGTISTDGYEHVPFWVPSFSRTPIDEARAVARFGDLLDDAVRRRMVADVPVGLFLSGGLDSSAIAVCMRRHSAAVRAFTIGFEERAFDETDHARTVARHLGLQHEVEVLSERRVMDLVPRVPEILDEPMADPSILPTHLVSVITRRHVTVALGGDGSDELLMGYRTYQALKVAGRLDALPGAARRGISAAGGRLPDRATGWLGRGRRFARGMGEAPEDRLLTRLGPFLGRARGVLAHAVVASLPTDALDEPREVIRAASTGAEGWADRSIAAYLRGYLQEDILVKVDRASMAASLEVRAPFLDPAVMDYVNGLPPDLKLRGFRRKHLLREAMRGHLPDAIIDRPKQGFGVPLDAWFRGPLRPWLGDLLGQDSLRAAGWFDPPAVRALLVEHEAGRADHGVRLWVLAQAEAWRRRWLTGDGA
jgi:asparagine synthase (glutamine-hydrolysing)